MRFGGGDFRRTLSLAVNVGRDADSSAAMAGSVVGAMVGYRALPADLRDRIGPLPATCLLPLRGVLLADIAAELAAVSGEVCATELKT